MTASRTNEGPSGFLKSAEPFSKSASVETVQVLDIPQPFATRARAVGPAVALT